jgi:dimethylhistidine N-methyltransferase
MSSSLIASPLVDLQSDNEDFFREISIGLQQPEKTLPCKFLYDEEGSRLFNQICELDEYYPTRTETKILRNHIRKITRAIGRGCCLVEFGSGTSAKTRLLLEHLDELASYIPIDISSAQLFDSCQKLAEDFPALEILPVSADYTGSFQLPDRDTSTQKTVAFFPGSTIGNFEPSEALWFLRRVASLCGQNGGLLVGVDLKKDRHILETAYNDRKGVTASFNLNLLARANRELGTDFDLSSFRHQAIYDEALGRIEMRLISLQPQIVRLGDQEFFFDEDEYITTEYSYKYSLVEFSELAQRAGFEVLNTWTDANKLFSVQYLGVRSASNQRNGEIYVS